MSRFRSNSVRLSEKHGVNPSVIKCFFCHEDKALALCGRLPDDKQAPREMVIDQEPCDACKAIMAKGIILISTRVGETDPKNPYRTGGWVAVTEEAFKRIFHGAEVEHALRKRACFIDDETWDMVGLPRGAMEGVPSSTDEFMRKEQTGGDSPST